MRISIPLEKLHPVELPTALKFAKFIEILDVEHWGAIWGVLVARNPVYKAPVPRLNTF